MLSSRVIAGALLIVFGIGWLLQTAGIVNFDSDIIAPVALIAIGVALVVGSPRGLHVPLLVVGIILAVAMSSNDAQSRRGNPPGGLRAVATQTPHSAAELRPYRIGAGTLTIDLTYLPLNGETYHVQASAGTGRIEIIVPGATSVTVNARTGLGSANVFGHHSAGASTRTVTTFAYAGRTRFVIDVRVGAGTIRVAHGVAQARA